ncbi:DUF2834 domain-containing protein [Limnoraphis robusta Tam1]|uniref:DUF2834 domain-containing protein n=1 Tax=Limnoraphis robusta CCNP1315 TaxID=3110306 RepID=A0ABU5U1V7_9CYAN|nr:DUF2834 domain-containing protein [Limnoraphis robusta]MEA5521180.1 DUF2834 domain-containing protein [Limnoraphis robusta CCNP1315]MEA5537939.1 DUF2834 domain-containing protein [Limnoraphis robusta Tam1]MEA5546670.1 DUF2834 domain-containing protein [Limnoraphis robusta CCNP1324]
MNIKKIIYLILAIAGLIFPWYYNIQFFLSGSLAEFVAASSGNLATQSISLDLFIATVVGSIWIYFESKRLNMKFGFIYILIGFLIAYSFALPLFLYVRETKLEEQKE